MTNKIHKEREVHVDKLRWHCDAKGLNFETTNDIKPIEEIIGQNRALQAIKLGLDIKSIGYNIFIAGFVGTGRNTTIKRLLEEIEKGEKAPDDICYVNNFKNPDMPKVIKIPAGNGIGFKKAMEYLIEALQKNIPSIFESEQYQARRNFLIESYKDNEKAIVREFEKKVEAESFTLIQVQMGPYARPEIVPIVAGNAINLDQLQEQVVAGKFQKEVYERLKSKQMELANELNQVSKKIRDLDKEMNDRISDLDHEFASPVVSGLIEEVKSKFSYDKIIGYLDDVRSNILGDLGRFKDKGEAREQVFPGIQLPEMPDPFNDFRVNVVVDNAETSGRPVIIETSPSYKNLFGSIERAVDRSGRWQTDFTKIKAGSLLRANGGYLVLNALDVLIEPGVWHALKRTLRNNIVEIQTYDPFYLFTTSALKPEPIDLDLKVVMIGSHYIYQLLYIYDEEFKKIFKVKADFDTEMECTEDNILKYAAFIKKICDEEKLLPFDKGAVTAVAEFGVRLAGRKNKMSTKFTKIRNIITESAFWASKDNCSKVSAKYVKKAINERLYRHNLVEEKIQEMIKDGTLMIDIDGMKIGQLNGLSVHDLGDYAFGRPSRITAETSIGRSGIINIEREAELSGRTHNKGVLILSGYLRGKYAQDKPLAMSASICFEQSYSGVDGDSASSTEIYALLSSLAGIPLRQDIAVTGSVNQKGEIQPIGGVNEKIEGFFLTCKMKGLTGNQGVMIPYQNIDDLMLKEEVIETVKMTKFHIYAVKTIDEGIEILSGMPAGEKQADGTYPEGTVNCLVDKRLKELAEALKKYGASVPGNM
ncbi:MAG: ATP-binding protein [Acidobacteriota bacterium]